MPNYSVRLQYIQQSEKKVVKMIQQHIMHAVSVTDAEIQVATMMEKEQISDYRVLSCSEYKMTDCLIDKIDDDNKWFLAKISYQFENDKGKIQKTFDNNLIYTENIKKAYKIVEEQMKNTSLDWSIDSISKTVIHSVMVENPKEVEV